MSWTKRFLELKRRGYSDADALNITVNERKLQRGSRPESEFSEEGTNGARSRNNSRK